MTSKSEVDTEEDFVILETFENMTDSSTSNASTIPEKQTFESSEKPSGGLEQLSGGLDSKNSESFVSCGESGTNEPAISDSFSSLGDSSINEKPYFESSRFIQKQLEKEKKLGVLGEGDGKEKGDEMCSEKGVDVGKDGGSGTGPGSGVETESGGSLEKEGGEEGKAIGGGIGAEMGESKGESSWLCVEGKELVGEGKDSGVGDEGSSLEESNQKPQGVVVSPGDALVDEGKTKELGTETPSVDEHRQDAKLIGGGIEKNEEQIKGMGDKLVNSSKNVSVCDVKIEGQVNVEDDKPNTSHAEDIPSGGQNEADRESGGSHNELVDQCSANKKNETAVEDSADEHVSSVTPGEPDLMSSNPQVEQDAPSLRGQIEECQQDNEKDNEPDASSCSLGHSHHSRSEDDGKNMPHQTSRDSTQIQAQPIIENESASKDSGDKPADSVQSNEPERDASTLQQAANNDPQMQAQQDAPQALNQLQNQPDDEGPPERPQEVNQPVVHNQRRSCCSWRGCLFFLSLFIALVAIGIVFIRVPVVISVPKPIVKINAKTHLPPTKENWNLVGKCQVYNSSYAIKHCQWKQIHPLPTTPENTVLPGGIKDCLPSTPSHPPTQDIDATLYDLKVPSDLGTYTFELACGHETEKPATKRVEIWVNELNPPIITVTNPKVTICISTGKAQLDVLCRAVQGKIVLREWKYIDGPPEIAEVTLDKDGSLELTIPGIYKFKYRCTDNFGGTALSPFITVHAKPAYVLGIDLGTSTTCMAIIKEDGTRKDIGIYEDDSDADPCMPSIVGFSRNGELLIGEKALRQAVVNPDSTIYEVKRLMGRSYYDDAEHKFLYRVRPTLKSHTLKGIRAAIEIPCGKSRKKLVQPELISALILRYVADRAQRLLGVTVKDVVISVPAQFDDAQRKATFDAGLIAGLNPIKIVNEPTVAAFAANSLTEKVLADANTDNDGEVDKTNSVWAVVADIGGGTTDYALMQIQGSYYKVITTDGDKTLGGRDIDLRLTEAITHILQDKYLGLDLTSSVFQQKLRIECENAKIVLSEKQQYSLTVEYKDEDENGESMPLEYLLTRDEFEQYVSPILDAMVKPLDSLLLRAGGRIKEDLGQGIKRDNIEDLYLVGGTSHIPKLKELLLSYFSNAKNVLHKDPVQLVSRGAAAFGAALTGLVQVQKMPRIDAVPLPISIAVDMDDMHEIFERNRLYPCIEKRVLTTYTNNQNAIVIKVYEGEGKTADECHFLGEFELSGIPPLPKNVPKIQATFKIDGNGILSVKASYGDVVKGGMKLDVYSKSGGMISKARDKMSLTLSKVMGPSSKGKAKCDALEDATSMAVIPVKPRKSNVLKLYVDSEYDSVQMVDKKDPNALIPAVSMVTVKGLVTDSFTKEADLDIVMVVDLSGSMSGIPIETMKNFMLKLIDRLKEHHRLGIVTYATNVYRNLELVSCTTNNKQVAKDIVNNFWTLGATNLYGGLLTGLQMAYHGRRRSRVLLFTDGYANDGAWITKEDIIREIVRETTAMSSVTQAQVTLSTFGYLGEHDHNLLQQLATNVGVGTYNFLNENSALVPVFGKVLGDAIYTIAENIELTITPLDNVQIVEAITEFASRKESEKMIFKIPSTADQQSRHVLLRLAVPPTREHAIHTELYRVELKYKNTLTELEEGSEEFLFVARTGKLDLESRSQDVDEQLNRVFVARQIQRALNELKSDASREKSAEYLKEAYEKIQKSESKGHTLSVCLSEDLKRLIKDVTEGDLNTARKLLQDSLTSHWQEKGGHASCYVTRKEDKLITIFETKK